jgi:hypothetical protein
MTLQRSLRMKNRVFSICATLTAVLGVLMTSSTTAQQSDAAQHRELPNRTFKLSLTLPCKSPGRQQWTPKPTRAVDE